MCGRRCEREKNENKLERRGGFGAEDIDSLFVDRTARSCPSRCDGVGWWSPLLEQRTATF